MMRKFVFDYRTSQLSKCARTLCFVLKRNLLVLPLPTWNDGQNEKNGWPDGWKVEVMAASVDGGIGEGCWGRVGRQSHFVRRPQGSEERAVLRALGGIRVRHGANCKKRGKFYFL